MKKRKLRRENFGDDAAYQAHLRASEAAKRAWITRRRNRNVLASEIPA